MHALVVFESMFGNTEQVAEAVSDGLSSHMNVDILEVGRAPTEFVDVGGAPSEPTDTVDLLVVGAPTHAFTLSRPESRRTAADQLGEGEQPTSAGIGLREWLADLRLDREIAAAAFDTRVRWPPLPGFAARYARRRLGQLGFRLVARPRSFYVAGTPGPLLPDERTRARRWGGELART